MGKKHCFQIRNFEESLTRLRLLKTSRNPPSSLSKSQFYFMFYFYFIFFPLLSLRCRHIFVKSIKYSKNQPQAALTTGIYTHKQCTQVGISQKHWYASCRSYSSYRQETPCSPDIPATKGYTTTTKVNANNALNRARQVERKTAL